MDDKDRLGRADARDFATATNWTGGVVPGPQDDAIIKGGVIVSSSTSEAVSSVQLDGAHLYITDGTFTATNGTGSGVNTDLIEVAATLHSAGLVLGGTVNNSGTIQLEIAPHIYFPPGYKASLLVAATGVTLTGGGKVQINGTQGKTSLAYVEGATTTATLTNFDNTISGNGDVGSGQMTLVNEAAGVIKGAGLVLDTGSNTIINRGLIDYATINSPIDNGGGVIVNGRFTHGGTIAGTLEGGIVVDGATVSVENPLNDVGLRVQNNGTLIAQGSLVSTPGWVVLYGGTLVVEAGSQFGAYVTGGYSGFHAVLDLAGGQTVFANRNISPLALSVTQVNETGAATSFVNQDPNLTFPACGPRAPGR